MLSTDGLLARERNHSVQLILPITVTRQKPLPSGR